MQCSVNCNHSLLIIYAHRCFIKFANFITSRTFLFKFTERSVPKTLTIIFHCGPTVNAKGCVGGVSFSVVQFPNMNFPLQLDSNATDRPFVIYSHRTEIRFSPGSFTVAKESTKLRGRETSERSFLQEAYYAINFSCFLGDKIGLITSEQNIIVPLPPLSLKNQRISSNARKGGRET